MNIFVRNLAQLWVHTCMYECTYSGIHICMCAHTYVYTYARTYVCSYVCACYVCEKYVTGCTKSSMYILK